MATTNSGVTDSGSVDADLRRPPTPLVPQGRRRRPALRPLATGAYFPVDLPAPAKAASPAGIGLLVALRVVPFAIVAAVVARWFVPGRFLAGGDTPPFVLDNLRTDLWRAWSHQVSGAGSSSYPMARALEAAAAAGGEALGLAEPTVQMLTAVAAALYATWAVASFVGRFVRPAAATLAGFAAVVNPYVLAVMPDLRPLVLVGLTASLVGAVWGIGSGRRVAPLALVLATVPVSLLAGEPTLLAALALAVLAGSAAAVAADGLGATLRLLRFGLWAVPLTLLVQLWWLVPAAQAFSSRREGVEIALDPGRSLLAAAAVLVPIAALAAAAGFDRLWRRAEARRRGSQRWRALGVEAIAVAGVVAVLALPLPLWSGDIATAAGTPKLPDGWRTAAAAVNTSPVRGKALVLPLAPAGRIATNWGYRGVDEVPRQLLTRPVLQGRPDATLRPAASADRRVAAVSRRLADGDVAAAAAGLDELGVSHLVIRRDLRTSAGDADLARTVERLRGWRPAARTDVADVYERVRSAPLARAVPVRDGAAIPAVTWQPRDAAHHVVTVDGAAGPFVLALGEAFGPGWQLTGLPQGWSAHHRMVDGYANGWLIDGTGPARLRITHRPSETARIAAYVSAAAAVLLAAVTLALWSRAKLVAASKTQEKSA